MYLYEVLDRQADSVWFLTQKEAFDYIAKAPAEYAPYYPERHLVDAPKQCLLQVLNGAGFIAETWRWNWKTKSWQLPTELPYENP